MKKRDLNRFKKAVERKREEAEARSHAAPGVTATGATGADPAAEQKLTAHERPQDVPDPRTKGSGHGQKTADKWNQ